MTTTSPRPDLDPRKVKDLATLSFVEAKANAALLGPPGVGKATSPWILQSRHAEQRRAQIRGRQQ
ncbi:ATP-binding protein [Streptomyces sp. NPDC048384]|uniref:ATP-binding protein n=1 Tax=Streptomyces sp. NPDC048384 TaxID=3155487 RepID=UPI00341361B0